MRIPPSLQSSCYHHAQSSLSLGGCMDGWIFPPALLPPPTPPTLQCSLYLQWMTHAPSSSLTPMHVQYPWNSVYVMRLVSNQTLRSEDARLKLKKEGTLLGPAWPESPTTTYPPSELSDCYIFVMTLQPTLELQRFSISPCAIC